MLNKIKSAMTVNVLRVYYVALIVGGVTGAIMGNYWVAGICAGLIVGDVLAYSIAKKSVDNHFNG